MKRPKAGIRGGRCMRLPKGLRGGGKLGQFWYDGLMTALLQLSGNQLPGQRPDERAIDQGKDRHVDRSGSEEWQDASSAT